MTLSSDFPRRGSCETSGQLKPDHDLETQLSLFSHVGVSLAGTHIALCCYLIFQNAIIWIFTRKWRPTSKSWGMINTEGGMVVTSGWV